MTKLPKGKENVWGVKVKSPAQRNRDQEILKETSSEHWEASKRLRGVFCEGHDDGDDGHWEVIQDVLTLAKHDIYVRETPENLDQEKLIEAQRYTRELYGVISRCNMAVIELASARKSASEKYVAESLFSDKGQVPTGTDNTTHVSHYCRHDDI